MGFVEKRNGRYRARYRDPLGRQRCETFSREADADSYLPTGTPLGTAEGALDCACNLYLDPFTPPDTPTN